MVEQRPEEVTSLLLPAVLERRQLSEIQAVEPGQLMGLKGVSCKCTFGE